MPDVGLYRDAVGPIRSLRKHAEQDLFLARRCSSRGELASFVTKLSATTSSTESRSGRSRQKSSVPVKSPSVDPDVSVRRRKSGDVGADEKKGLRGQPTTSRAEEIESPVPANSPVVERLYPGVGGSPQKKRSRWKPTASPGEDDDSWKNEIGTWEQRFPTSCNLKISLMELARKDLSDQDRKDIARTLSDIWQQAAPTPSSEIDVANPCLPPCLPAFKSLPVPDIECVSIDSVTSMYSPEGMHELLVAAVKGKYGRAVLREVSYILEHTVRRLFLMAR